MDIEKATLETLSPEDFYRTHQIVNSKLINVDSLNSFTQDTVFGSYEVTDFDRLKNETKFYPDFNYYSQNFVTDDYINEEEIKEKRILGVTPVPEIAYFKSIKFNYANFILDKRSNKTVGYIFTTKSHADSSHYDNTMHLIRKELGDPEITYSGFSNDDGGGPAHWPLKYDVWYINKRMWQFSQVTDDRGGKKLISITLLILDKNLVDVFESSFNYNFDILGKYFDKERTERFMLEGFINERIEKKDMEKARITAREKLKMIKKQQ